MRETLRAYRVYRKEEERTSAIELTVLLPSKSVGLEEFYCEIQCDELFKREKRIYGASAEQAGALAIKFAEQLLSGGGFVDEHGNPVEL